MLYVGLFGYYADDTNLYYVRARWLEAVIAKWLSRDPIGFGGGDYNLLRVVEGCPTMLIDPSGTEVDISCKSCGVCGEQRYAKLNEMLNYTCNNILPALKDGDWAGILDCAMKKSGYFDPSKKKILLPLVLDPTAGSMETLKGCLTSYCGPNPYPNRSRQIHCQSSHQLLKGDNHCALGKGKKSRIGAWTDPAGVSAQLGARDISICVDNVLPCDPNNPFSLVQPLEGNTTNIYGVPCQQYGGIANLASLLLHEMVHGCGIAPSDNSKKAPGNPPPHEQLTQAITCCIIDAAGKNGVKIL